MQKNGPAKITISAKIVSFFLTFQATKLLLLPTGMNHCPTNFLFFLVDHGPAPTWYLSLSRLQKWTNMTTIKRLSSVCVDKKPFFFFLCLFVALKKLQFILTHCVCSCCSCRTTLCIDTTPKTSGPKNWPLSFNYEYMQSAHWKHVTLIVLSQKSSSLSLAIFFAF